MKISRKLISDYIFSFLGLILVNGVLSFLIHPSLGHRLGEVRQGSILFYCSAASMLGGTLGSAANYGRLKILSNGQKTENGEYNRFLLLCTALTAVLTGLVILIKKDAAGSSYAGIFLVFVLTTVRYYADVEYRLSLNYKRFCLYYTLVAAGYLSGFLLFPLTGSWTLIFILGESAGILYTAFTGSIFKGRPLSVTEYNREHQKTLWVLSASYFPGELIASCDRLLLPLLLADGDRMTTIFYYAAVVGKMMSLLSTPLNGVLSGYIAREKGGLSRKQFLKILLFMLGLFAVFSGVSVLGSHLYVWLFRREVYAEAKPLFLLANAGQVIFFICNTLMVIVLRFTDEKNQVIVNTIYFAAFFLVTVPLIRRFGAYGLGYGILAVNCLKFLLYAVFGLKGLRKSGGTDVTF